MDKLEQVKKEIERRRGMTAEERALERFPVHKGASKEWIESHLKGICAEYIEGYRQAEKDLSDISWIKEVSGVKDMSRAKEEALKAYPPRSIAANYDTINRRDAFEYGYLKAEKDLELTWEENGKFLTQEPVSKELEKAAVEAFKEIVDDGRNSFLEIFKAGAEWKEEQMMAKVIDGDITFDYYGDDDKTYGCIAHNSFCLEDMGLKDRDKVKIVVIK